MVIRRSLRSAASYCMRLVVLLKTSILAVTRNSGPTGAFLALLGGAPAHAQITHKYFGFAGGAM